MTQYLKTYRFTTLVRHFANVANASDQYTHIGPMRACLVYGLVTMLFTE